MTQRLTRCSLNSLAVRKAQIHRLLVTLFPRRGVEVPSTRERALRGMGGKGKVSAQHMWQALHSSHLASIRDTPDEDFQEHGNERLLRRHYRLEHQGFTVKYMHGTTYLVTDALPRHPTYQPLRLCVMIPVSLQHCLLPTPSIITWLLVNQ